MKKEKSKVRRIRRECVVCRLNYEISPTLLGYSSTCSQECADKYAVEKREANARAEKLASIVAEQTVVHRKEKKRRRRERFRRYKDDFYRSAEWLQLRFKVIAEYGRECMACGTTKGSMHVDHIKPRSKFPQLELEFDNLQVLCKECNYGKSNLSSIDFRPQAGSLMKEDLS